MSLTTTTDYRAFLQETLRQRAHGNPQYSLRAFARDLSMTPGRLSEILNRKRGLSLSVATRIAQKLGLSFGESQIFCDLVLSADARSASLKKLAELRLRETRDVDAEHRELQEDVFQAISEWQHFAILELTELETFRSDYGWIARALRLSRLDAELSCERLLRLGLLELDAKGVLRKAPGGGVTTTRDVPSAAIREFNRRVFTKASEAIGTQPVAERDFSTITFAMDPGDVAFAKEEIKKFRRALSRKLERGRKKSVYCLSTQLFRLDSEVR